MYVPNSVDTHMYIAIQYYNGSLVTDKSTYLRLDDNYDLYTYMTFYLDQTEVAMKH